MRLGEALAKRIEQDRTFCACQLQANAFRYGCELPRVTKALCEDDFEPAQGCVGDGKGALVVSISHGFSRMDTDVQGRKYHGQGTGHTYIVLPSRPRAMALSMSVRARMS